MSAVLLPALPSRSTARASLVLSSHAPRGWNPKPPLKLPLAPSLPECAVTSVASRSITTCPISLPAVRDPGSSVPVSSPRASQARLGPGQPDRREHPGSVRNPGQYPPDRRGRRDRPGRPVQALLISRHLDVADRHRAVGDRDRHIDQHPARVVPPRGVPAGRRWPH